SATYDYIECRSLGMQYVPLCAPLCSVCVVAIADGVTACGQPACQLHLHLCNADTCSKATKPHYLQMVHLCRNCRAPVWPGTFAADSDGSNRPRFGDSCGHVLCGECSLKELAGRACEF